MPTEKPHREPASGPTIPKAPAGHPAAKPDEASMAQTSAPREQPAAEETVNYGGRIPKSLRQRARVFVATHDVEHQEFLADALREYLDRNGG